MTKFIIGAALTLSVSSTVLPSVTHAATNNDKKETATLSDKQVSVEYVTYVNNAVVFRVNVDNPAGISFRLVIKNDAGDILYNGAFTDVHFEKAIHLVKEEDEISPVFIIRSGKQQIERTFRVSSTTAGTEKVIVTKQ